MTAEQVFKYYRSYKLYYAGRYDFQKYHGGLKMPLLIKQQDRSFYYKVAQKLPDHQIHSLFAQGFFFNPRAHISEFVSPDRQSESLKFASRAENGPELL